MPLPKIFIIILQYNNSQDTIRCLNSVKKLDYPNYGIIVVDNASSLRHLNSTRLFIENEKRLSPNTKYQLLITNYNLGYSGGNNVGIKYALKRRADYVFILNPDTSIASDVLTKLVEVAEANSQIGIVGPAINERGRSVCGGKIEWLRPTLRHLSAPLTKPCTLNAKCYLVGAAILIKRGVIEKIGLLDERYFLYFEDTDYCVRARKAGYELTIAPEAKITHVGSASTGQLGPAFLLRFHYRNAHLFNFKNGPWYIKLALPFWSFFIIIKQLIKIIFVPAKRKISRAILAGVTDFYRGRFGKISN